MNFDFPTFLVGATVVTGVIWLLDALFFAPKRNNAVLAARTGTALPAIPERYREPWWVEYSRAFFPVILIVLLLRSFLVEPFRIPSGSMMPTLLVGDFILVNKFSYGVRLPVINKKVLDVGRPETGDVVVFRFPPDPSKDYIKRIIGVPGDKVDYRKKALYINDKLVPQDRLGTYAGKGSGLNMSGFDHNEEFLGKVKHSVLIDTRSPDNPRCQVLANGPITIPPGYYFAMGDNRDRSSDGRCWGLVPDENLVGKAFFIWFNLDFDASWVPDWGRIGTVIE